MNVPCVLISVFSGCCLLSSVVNGACPAGAPGTCTCESGKVICKNDGGITDIPSWIPNNTINLEFEGCNIQYLSNSSFKHFNPRKIRVFKQRRRVTLNDSSVFQGLNDLETIGLDDNNIVSLPNGLFADLPSLLYVFLDSNPLVSLPDDLFTNSPKLQLLRVTYTQLDKATIEKIGAGHFGTSITTLALTGTRIENLKDELFSGLPKLRTLVVSNCGIKSIGADILKGTVVSFISFDDNPIEFINENAFPGSKVTTFQCNNCQLTSSVMFNGFLKKMTQLSIITVKNNNITHVPQDAFTGLTRLSIINLSNNSISTIENNAYADLPQCVSVDCVQLQDNPLNCDCNLAWLRSFSSKLVGVDNAMWKCAQPASVSGRNLTSLDQDKFCCEGANSTSKCGLEPTKDPNNAWMVSAHIMVAIISQIMVVFGIPLFFA